VQCAGQTSPWNTEFLSYIATKQATGISTYHKNFACRNIPFFILRYATLCTLQNPPFSELSLDFRGQQEVFRHGSLRDTGLVYSVIMKQQHRYFNSETVEFQQVAAMLQIYGDFQNGYQYTINIILFLWITYFIKIFRLRVTHGEHYCFNLIYFYI
jgi:hypothetical protein